MIGSKRFLPAEWHAQSAVMLTWPHPDTDWAPYLDEAYICFAEIANAVAARELLLVVCPYPELVWPHILPEYKANVRVVSVPSNDTWARDHGPITVIQNGALRLFDFTFNGWGMKFAANFDNQINRRLVEQSVFNADVVYENQLSFVFEGGSIESDGEGTLLTTSDCLLSPNRNDGMSKAQIEAHLLACFGADRVLWLDNGYLEGDDTDSHIDTLARLCSPSSIAYVQCTDTNDVHFEALRKMEEELQNFRTAQGKPYELIALPMTPALYYEGDRLPATYANFLIVNGAVLVPTYGLSTDAQALSQMSIAFPNHEIVPIRCEVLVKQHGSLHCVTMQFPAGVLSKN